jgi:hypothetical protein
MASMKVENAMLLETQIIGSFMAVQGFFLHKFQQESEKLIFSFIPKISSECIPNSLQV